MRLDHIYTGDALDTLRTLPDGEVNCVVTSPPYYGLRDYGVAGQIGLEQSMGDYIGKLVELFREIRRVLKVNGTAWLNLGDSYAGGKGQSGSQGAEHQDERNKNQISINKGYQTLGGKKQTKPTDNMQMLRESGIRPKSLMMIPARVAIALQDDGWILRSEIIWSKPNPMPESVTDRPTKAHEMIYLFAKSPQYFYDADAIREPLVVAIDDLAKRQGKNAGNRLNYQLVYGSNETPHGNMKPGAVMMSNPAGRNARSVWTIATQPTPHAHFATFPHELVRRCILAGCPVDGVVLDPFMGSGTTALVARTLNRRYVGIELNPAYVEMAEKRLAVPFQTDMFYHAGIDTASA